MISPLKNQHFPYSIWVKFLERWLRSLRHETSSFRNHYYLRLRHFKILEMFSKFKNCINFREIIYCRYNWALKARKISIISPPKLRRQIVVLDYAPHMKQFTLERYELRGCPRKNRPLEFRSITEFPQIFTVRYLIYSISKKLYLLGS